MLLIETIFFVVSSSEFFESAFGPDSFDNSRVCPGICLPVQMAIFCPSVLDQIQCFTPNNLCCVRRGGSLPYDLQTINHIPNIGAVDINKSGTINNFNNSNSQNDPTKCPGSCMLKSSKETCEKPAIIIPNTSNCIEDTICCDNTRMTVTQRPTKPRPRPTTTTTTAPIIWSTVYDTRKECPGLCIANFIRFTCYGTFLF